MEDESDDFHLFEAPSSPTPSKSSSTDEEEEVPLNQQTPRITEINSVTGDWSRSSRDLNGNGVYEPSTSHWGDRPGTDGSSTDSDEDHPMETDGGDSSSLLQRAIEVAQRWSPPLQRANEEISTVQRSDWGQPLHFVFGMEPRETVEALFSRAEAFIQELLRSLSLSRSDYPPPPGRLPVSISPESSSPSGGIQLKINLKNRTSSIVQGRDIPPRFRNDRNKGLPTMDVSAASIQEAFDRAGDHLSFWLTRLITMIDDENEGDEAIKPENYYPTFELFQKEFLDFDEMVTFALKRLRPLVGLEVIEALNERHKDVQNKYWKLEVAVLTGRFKDQEGYISNVADDIENVLRSLWSIYTTD